MRNMQKIYLICGLLGCLCFGGGDWLMIYGDPQYLGTLSWLTAGTAVIPQWRYNLAMTLAFPGIVFYGIALFAVENYIAGEKERKRYHYLNAFGLTPWIALHLFYIMILVLFSWMNANGFVLPAVLAGPGQRGADAAGVPILVLSADHGKNRLSEGHGLYQCADPLCRLKGYIPTATGQRVSFGLHQRVDE